MKQLFSNLVNQANSLFGETLNPVFVKETRQTLHGKTFWFTSGAVLLAQIFISYLYTVTRFESPRDGKETTIAYLGIYCFIYFISVMILGGSILGRWAYERTQDALTPEYTTPLSPVRILNGKIQAMLFFCAVLFVIGSPTALYLLLMGKLPMLNFLPMIFMIPTLLSLIMTAALLNRLKKGSASTASGGAVAGVILYTIFFFPFFGYSTNTYRTPEIHWIPWLLFCFAVASMCYFYSLAILRPPKADKLFPARIAGLIIMLLIPVFLRTAVLAKGEEMELWSALLCLYGAWNLLIAANERFRITERMKNDLPKQSFLRWGALFFSSGAYGGHIYGFAFLLAGTLLAMQNLPAEKWAVPTIGCYILFYTLLTLWIRRWKPEWNSLVILISIFAACNLISLLSIVHPSGIFSIFCWYSISYITDGKMLIAPLVLSGIALVLLLLGMARQRGSER